MIVTERGNNHLNGVPLAHLLKGSGGKPLKGCGAVWIFRDPSIPGDDRVMRGERELEARSKEGDRLLLALKEQRQIRSAPHFPGDIRKGALPGIQVTHRIGGSGGDFRLQHRILWHRVSKNEGAHVAIWPPSSRSPLRMILGRLTHEQDRYSLLIGGPGFCLRDFLPGRDGDGEGAALFSQQPFWQEWSR